MAYDVIKLDYGLAEDMARIFKEGEQQLQNTLREMQAIASMLEDGALKGQGGEAFVDALKTSMTSSLNNLISKFGEMNDDVLNAIKEMKEADEESRRLLSSF